MISKVIQAFVYVLEESFVKRSGYGMTVKLGHNTIVEIIAGANDNLLIHDKLKDHVQTHLKLTCTEYRKILHNKGSFTMAQLNTLCVNLCQYTSIGARLIHDNSPPIYFGPESDIILTLHFEKLSLNSWKFKNIAKGSKTHGKKHFSPETSVAVEEFDLDDEEEDADIIDNSSCSSVEIDTKRIKDMYKTKRNPKSVKFLSMPMVDSLEAGSSKDSIEKHAPELEEVCLETIDTRAKINSLLLKQYGWLLKVDHALIAKTADCQLCPRHCINILSKTTSASVGRRVKKD